MRLSNLCIYKGISMDTMLDKLQEETQEVIQAAENIDIENLKEELMDVIQTCYGIAAVACIDLEKCVEPHNQKLLSRGYTLSDTHTEFERVTDEMHELYKVKNKNYGNSFSEQYREYGLTSVCIRLDDKIRRLKSLNSDSSNIHDESVRDTLIDTANYSVLAVMEIDKNFK